MLINWPTVRRKIPHYIRGTPLARPPKQTFAPLEQPDVIAHYLASIVDSSDDAILSKDLNSIIRSWNKGAERLFGYTAEEAVGKPVTMLMPPDRLNEESSILDRIQRGERIEHYETIRRRKDGSLVEISITVSPIRTPEGHIIGASKIARDITERRQAQERQQFLIRELRHRSANLFAVVQSIAGRSLVEPYSLARRVERSAAGISAGACDAGRSRMGGSAADRNHQAGS